MTSKEGGGGPQHRTVLLDSPDEVKPYVYQVYPARSQESFDGLKATIREKGILDPLYLAGDYSVVDGHHRTRAWIELLAEGIDVAPVVAHVFENIDPHEMRDLAFDLNNTRQLTSDEKRTTVKNQLLYLAEYYEEQGFTGDQSRMWDDTRIARKVNVERKLVRNVREAMEEEGVIPRSKYVVSLITHPNGSTYERATAREDLVRSTAFSSSTQVGEQPRPLSLVLPDGEILEANTHEELQQKLKEKLEQEEADRQAQEAKLKEENHERLKKLEQSYTKDLADWLETWRNPDEAPTIPNIPVEVWEEAIKRAKSNRTEKVEQVALSAGMNASELKEYEPEEVIEFVLQSDWRDLEIDQYKFAADWYRHAVEAIERRLERPVQAIR